MKIHSHQLLVPVLFCLIAFSFPGCSDEPSCPDEGINYYFLGEFKRSRIPYTGFDTITYTTNNNLTEFYFGNGTQQRFTENKTRDPNPDCNVYQTDKYEVLQFTFRNTDKSDSLFLQLEDYSGNCTFIGNNCTFYFTLYAFKFLDTNIDSIYLNNKWYFNHTTLINSQLDTLIVNKENGILKCTNFNTGKYITINK